MELFRILIINELAEKIMCPVFEEGYELKGEIIVSLLCCFFKILRV